MNKSEAYKAALELTDDDVDITENGIKMSPHAFEVYLAMSGSKATTESGKHKAVRKLIHTILEAALNESKRSEKEAE